jgi:hypothetical protein
MPTHHDAGSILSIRSAARAPVAPKQRKTAASHFRNIAKFSSWSGRSEPPDRPGHKTLNTFAAAAMPGTPGTESLLDFPASRQQGGRK